MTGSYWQRDAAWSERWHEGSLPKRVDFAILGGGLAGLATAIRLRELHAGAEIVVLEAERVGYGASGRNAGFLSPLAAPVWLLGADRDSEHAWAAARINADMHATARWLREHAIDAELSDVSLRLDAAGTLSHAGMGEFARAVAHVGLAHRLPDDRRYRSLEMDAYTVHPYKLVRGLAEHAVTAGVRIRERARVRAVEAALGGARVYVDSGEQLHARKVVVCTNGYTDKLDVGERIRAVVVHSFMLASAPLAPSDDVRDDIFTVVVNALDQAFHRVHDNRLLYGGTDKVRAPEGDDYAVPASVESKLVTQLQNCFPRIAGITSADAWAGRFHATRNGLPIIRPSTKNPAVILNVGYGGTGVVLTLACARLAAAVASDGAFANDSDARLLSIIHGTRISVGDALRTVGRLTRRLMFPSRAG